MKKRVVVIAAIMVILAGLLSFSVASAEPGKLEKMDGLFQGLIQSENPEAFFKALSESDRSLVLEALEVVEVREDIEVVKVDADTPGILLLSCYYGERRRVGENILGYDLWRYFHRVDWCTENGTTISGGTSWNARGEVNAPFWQYSGVISSTTQGGAGYTFYRAFSQGEFKLCLPDIACAQFQYPWIDITGYPNATYIYSGGGGSGW